jgi:coatomer protein complex subunit epsilon
MYRAYLASNRHRVVLDEISASNSTPLLALRHQAEYFSDRNRFDEVIKKLEEGAADDGHIVWIISAACLYINEGAYEEALRILHGQDDLECLAMQIYVFLQLDRPELAKKTHQQMQEKDDDATLTQLALAWINIELGGEKLQDAFYILDDFQDKFQVRENWSKFGF